ncbi:hypothetical protein QTO34_017785 [Cnephaeus nilssonii]|uniref:Taste receptor type 2 n=1 Tax=Cnephaeus nilssonii TaxID=3371016 RepID=A0AA40I1R6_CNENI|nr:hypothetical protein QTO34_017785 [Eptesicus nilssonii]
MDAILQQFDYKFITQIRIRNLDFFPVEMPTGLEIIFLILSIAEFIIGMLGNVFIGLVNCSEWVKNQNISLADFIFTCLAISRISQLLVLLIAHFSHSLFLWLKWRMNRVILVIFVFSFIFLIFDFLLLEGFNDLFLHVYMQDYSNLTLYMEESKTLYFETLILLSLTCLLPIVLSLTSLLLLFLSLVRHIRNLQLNSMGSRDSSTEAHKRAIKMVMSFLFLFILYFFSTQVVNWIFLMFPSHVIIKFISLLVYVFPSSHSFLLILGNSKLRQTALKVLWHLKSSLRRENLLYLYRHISQKMPSGTETVFLVAAMGEFITGMLGNGFIVLVNCIDWVKSQKLSAADCILTSLALSRITLLWISLADSFLMVLWPRFYDIEKLAKLIGIFWILCNHLATWFATCLSIFYFFKIANFSHPCFAWLRWRTGKVLLVLLLGSLFFLLLKLVLIDSFNGFWIKVENIHERNSTWSPGISETLYLNSLMFTAPFISFLDETYQECAGWCFLVVQKQEANLAVMLTWTIFPSGHSFILILGNSKLRQTALGLLWHLNCHLKKGCTASEILSGAFVTFFAVAGNLAGPL